MTVDRIEIELAACSVAGPDQPGNRAGLFLEQGLRVERIYGSPIDRLAHDDTQMFIAPGWPDRPLAVRGCRCSRMVPGEVKRMYVVPGVRTTGNRQQAANARCVEAALTAKLPVLRLETTEFLPDAQRLYRAKGFVPCPAYGPYRDNPINLYLEKILLPKSVL